MIIAILVVALLIAVVMLIFAISNATPVSIDLVFARIPTQVSLAMIVSFAAGIVVGLLLMLPGSIRNSLAIAGHKRRISELEKAAPPKESPAPPKAAPLPPKETAAPLKESPAPPAPPASPSGSKPDEPPS